MIGPVDFVGLEHLAVAEAPWREPLDVLAGLADRDGVVGLASDGGPEGRWSFVMAGPDRVTVVDPGAASGFDPLADLRLRAVAAGAPAPFAGGWIGVASYDLGARRLIGRAAGDWPDLILMRFPAVIAFDHVARRVVRIGRGSDLAGAEARLADSQAWLSAARPTQAPSPPAASWRDAASPEAYRAAVADVVRRIGEGELFQANIGRAFEGELAPRRDPFDVFLRSALSGPAPYSAWLRLGDRALVSNSPERFLRIDEAGRLEALPIKGTAPRGRTPDEDAAGAARLLASAKDRAENLMIVDLMRNDLARVSQAGGVAVEELFALRSYERVHHLVSRVTARPRPGLSVADALEATFPPGSITGAPKHQAMRVIAGHEPPRGPWCGSMFHVGADGGFDASVLIRTLAFGRSAGAWTWRGAAGAGITADSDPEAELRETDLKMAALRAALTGQQQVMRFVRRGLR